MKRINAEVDKVLFYFKSHICILHICIFAYTPIQLVARCSFVLNNKYNTTSGMCWQMIELNWYTKTLIQIFFYHQKILSWKKYRKLFGLSIDELLQYLEYI